MVAKKGLGKGLDSMIPEKVNKVKNEDNLDNVSRETLIDISEIEPNMSQPRKNFDDDALLELSDSIKEFGIIQPLVIQKKEKNYEIIAGERRWRAAKLAGLKQVPCIVKNYTSQQIVEISLIENIQREDLNAIEEALAYQRLINEFNLKQDEVAERVSKSRAAVTNSIRLLKLDARIQQMLIDDMISTGHARTIIPIEDKEVQYSIAMKIFDENLSVRETEKLIKKIMEAPDDKIKKENEIDDSLVYKDIEEKIKGIFGTKVSINKKNRNKGKIEIEYYSNDELERIIELFETIQA
ncbi:ParB/RepB/Spo0J family partition protein [Anaeromicropila herbilytica]|uniref:Chromosome partitioning protein ParB n=1 Tax=Anaeromicropila herbilytica TaxID=2785025 RepID=A0A7R7EQP2_9FIRM|nr:ParB/RepB/Spo0J family partition protein [Anaeromicropila herbilytica]BCN33016.1 chromosome partitioning protein ParB [Anaeromicropila herbilytica]